MCIDYTPVQRDRINPMLALLIIAIAAVMTGLGKFIDFITGMRSEDV